MYDLTDMISYINSITNTKIFVVGHSQVLQILLSGHSSCLLVTYFRMSLIYFHSSQGTIMSLATFTQPNIEEMVEAAALLCPISYLEHITAPFVLRMVNMHLDQVFLIYCY